MSISTFDFGFTLNTFASFAGLVNWTTDMSFMLQEQEWHKGEAELQSAMHHPPMDNPTVPSLSPQLANHLRVAPLVAIGLLDTDGQPWTTLWGGEGGVGAAIAQGIIGIRTPVTPKYDPVVESLFGDAKSKEVVRPEGQGRMISGLTIDLETRKRTKMYGRMVAGAVDHAEDEVTETTESNIEAQLVLRIEQSLGNCPKYINSKHIVKAQANPKLISDSPQLSQEALDLLEEADLFFVSSAQHDQDMDTNHRGGPPGFVRVIENESDGAVICWPEYSGNRFYQTLGNLRVNPVVGLCVPNFETGDMLYVTGKTEILVGADAKKLLPKTNLAVKVKITASRMVTQALPFRGEPGERSPYNPQVRFLYTEKKQIQADDQMSKATLKKKTKITPSISRYRFSLDKPAKYKSGQYVTFDFSDHLDHGYQHMSNDDPSLINDDFVRTFTVSSSPDPKSNGGLQENEFEITIRHVGRVTDFLSKAPDSGTSGQTPLEVDVKGFGGDFEVAHTAPDDRILFISAGIGITPLLPALHHIDIDRLRLLWAVRAPDVPLAKEVLKQHPAAARVTTLLVTGSSDGEDVSKDEELKKLEVTIHARRLAESDLEAKDAERIYICAAPGLRKQVSEWLPNKELIYEDFNF